MGDSTHRLYGGGNKELQFCGMCRKRAHSSRARLLSGGVVRYFVSKDSLTEQPGSSE